MAKDEQQHSPLPWTRSTFLIKSKHGDHVTHCGMGNLPPSRSTESEANARFIVRAANSHDALLDACRQFVHWYAEDSTEEKRDNAYDAAVKAIALAEKES